MYDYNNINNSLNNFIKKIEEYLEELTIKQKETKELLTRNRIINEISSSFSIDTIIKYKNKIISLSPNLKEELDILTFLYENNAIETEQAKTIIEVIKRQNIFKENINVEELSIKLSNIEKDIELCNKVLIDKEYDNDLLITIFNKLNIEEKDQLNILSRIILTKFDRIEEVKEEKEIEVKEDNLDTSKLIEKFNKLNEEIKNIVEKYYMLIKGKDEKYLSYAKEMCSIIRESKLNNEENDLENNFNYPEENLTLFIIGLLGYKNEVTNILNNNDKIDKDTYEEIELLLEIIEEELDKKEELINDYELTKQEENLISSNVYMLIDENNNVFFDESDFQKDDYKKIVSLIDKLDKGIHDYERGIQHTRIQTNYKDYAVFINRTSDLCCSYIRINSDIALIINYDRLNNIYDSTDQILFRNKELIKDTIYKILLLDKNTLSNQNKVKEYYIEKGVSKKYE